VVAARPVEVPILLSAEGPKGLEIAQRIADGVISFGRPRSGFAWNAVLLHGTVLPDGPVDEDYLLAAAGAGAGAAYHITYAGGGEAVDRLPNGAQYRAAIERHPVEQRDAAVWGQHLLDATPEERAALTPHTVRETTFTGTAAELRDRLQEMGKGGATEVIYQPAGPDIERELTAFARMAGIGADVRDD
jgi:5,10-methylenetetrahydromethanopterin reductase